MVNVGLVLEGGGMRGVYTAGVLDFFLENKIEFKNIYGVSAGACHACSYVSKQKVRAIKTVIDFLDDNRYASFRNLLLTGSYFGKKFVYETVPKELLKFDYETFEKSIKSQNFYAVITNVKTGKAEYKKITDLPKEMDYICASASLPLISRYIKFGKEKYLDGGISDSIPIKKSIADGNRKNVVILTQHNGYTKKKSNLLPVKMRYFKYPEFVKSNLNRYKDYNETLKFLEKESDLGNVLVIQPKQEVNIGRLEKNKEKLLDLYQKGYDDAKENFSLYPEFFVF